MSLQCNLMNIRLAPGQDVQDWTEASLSEMPVEVLISLCILRSVPVPHPLVTETLVRSLLDWHRAHYDKTNPT